MTKSDTNEELKALKKALRKEQRKNKTLEEKYNSVKHQNKILKCGNKKKSGRTDSVLALREGAGGRGATVSRHRHGEIAIRFAVLLYAFAGISSHQVPRVMQLAGLLWNGITDGYTDHEV